MRRAPGRSSLAMALRQFVVNLQVSIDHTVERILMLDRRTGSMPIPLGGLRVTEYIEQCLSHAVIVAGLHQQAVFTMPYDVLAAAHPCRYTWQAARHGLNQCIGHPLA